MRIEIDTDNQEKILQACELLGVSPTKLINNILRVARIRTELVEEVEVKIKTTFIEPSKKNVNSSKKPAKPNFVTDF